MTKVGRDRKKREKGGNRSKPLLRACSNGTNSQVVSVYHDASLVHVRCGDAVDLGVMSCSTEAVTYHIARPVVHDQESVCH